jgi:glycosyltransferase involved in cell wall biosynthesis
MGKRRLRVLFDCPNPTLHGGPPTHLPLLEAELRRQVDLESFDYGRKTDTETIFEKLVARIRDLIKFRTKISRFRPDLIHHNTAFDTRAIIRDAALVCLARRYGIPVLLKMHGSLDELFGKVSSPVDCMRTTVLKNADYIGVLSDVEKSKFLTAWPSLCGRIRVVKNIIRPDFYEVERHEAQQPTVLFISRFIRQKGIFDLLEAVPGVLRKFPSARFVFVGSGNDAAEFDAKVKQKQLTPFITRMGHLNNTETAKFYSSAWTLVFPTHFPEGMPMVVAEAMAAGVPIITTKTNFSCSYMSAGEHCLFLDGKNYSSIEAQIVHLLQDRELRRRMTVNNRELAKSFRAETVTREFLKIYEHITSLRFGPSETPQPQSSYVS